MNHSLHFVKKQGSAVLEFADQFADLRIAVFRDFPYLYEGTHEYEMDYIKTYAACPDAMVFFVFDKSCLVGATTCIPLADETENVRQPFLQKDYEIECVFYFGESILLKPYRGMGLGHRFFDERESFASSFGRYHTTAFCSVNRAVNHPMKPYDYIPNDSFWTKRGYEKQEDMTCQMEWKDLDQECETTKSLTFWTKALAQV